MLDGFTGKDCRREHLTFGYYLHISDACDYCYCAGRCGYEGM